MLADGAAVAVAEVAGDVELDRRLGEGEEARPHAHLALAEDGADEELDRAAEVGERDPAVDGEPLDLVEDGCVRRVERVAPVRASERDEVDRRLLRLHRADLRGRRVRAQQRLGVEVEGVARIARGVRLGLVERVEVVPDGLDLAPVVDLVAHPEEDVLDPAAQLRDQMQAAAPERLAGQRRVERLPVLCGGSGELGLAAGERLLDRRPGGVQRHPGLAVANLAQRQLQLALAAEVADAQLLERVGVRGRCDRGPRLVLERRGVHRATIASAS